VVGAATENERRPIVERRCAGTCKDIVVGVGRINKVELRRTHVGTAISSHLWRVDHPSIYPGHSCQLSLAIPLWVGAMSTGDGFSHRWGRNGEFCVAAGPVIRTAGLYASLIGCDPR